MNKSESIAFAELEKRGFTKIRHNPSKSPDFWDELGNQWEVKKLYGDVILFRESQKESCKGCSVLVVDTNKNEIVTEFKFDDYGSIKFPKINWIPNSEKTISVQLTAEKFEELKLAKGKLAWEDLIDRGVKSLNLLDTELTKIPDNIIIRLKELETDIQDRAKLKDQLEKEIEYCKNEAKEIRLELRRELDKINLSISEAYGVWKGLEDRFSSPMLSYMLKSDPKDFWSELEKRTKIAIRHFLKEDPDAITYLQEIPDETIKGFVREEIRELVLRISDVEDKVEAIVNLTQEKVAKDLEAEKQKEEQVVQSITRPAEKLAGEVRE